MTDVLHQIFYLYNLQSVSDVVIFEMKMKDVWDIVEKFIKRRIQLTCFCLLK